MARVVVIFAILSLIAGAMYWIARQPTAHNEASVTLPVKPVAASEKPAETAPAPETTTTTPDVPPTGGDASNVAALNATGAAANVLQQETTTAPAAQTGLVVESVEAAGANALALKGRADPGATVKVSVNGKAAGEVTVAAAGTWSLTVDKGTGEGDPKIALELVAAGGKVLDNANFVYKTAAAVPPLAPQDEAIVTQRVQAPTVKPAKPRRSLRAVRVREGESLWSIAERRLGDGEKWRALYKANKRAIGGDPNFLRAGTRLVLPS